MLRHDGCSATVVRRPFSAGSDHPVPARIITYEEYHPFGTTAWWAENSALTARRKRYRYTGKERDEWTGLCYHGARYYMPWLGRWERCDPIGMGDGVNRYAYCRGNPIGGRDPRGMAEVEVVQPPTVGETWGAIYDAGVSLVAGAMGKTLPTSTDIADAGSRLATTGVKSLVAVEAWLEEHPRVGGSLDIAAGLGEGAAGATLALAAPEGGPLTVGLVAASVGHGVDTAISGLQQVVTAKETRTETSRLIEAGLVAAGYTEDAAVVAAERGDAALGIVLSAGTGYLASAPRAPAAIRAAQEAAAARASAGRITGPLGTAQSWWLRGAEGDQAWRASSLADRFLADLGQKTMSAENYAKYGRISDPAERGREMLRKEDVLWVLKPEASGWRLGVGTTFHTGPTPALRLYGPRGAGAVGAGARLPDAYDR